MKDNLLHFASTFAEAMRLPWCESRLYETEMKRGADDLIDAYYDLAVTLCSGGPKIPGKKSGTDVKLTPSEIRARVDKYLSVFLPEYKRIIDGHGTPQLIRAEARRIFEATPEFRDVPELGRLLETIDTFPPESTLQSIVEKRVVVGQAVTVGGELVDAVRPRREPDWNGLSGIIRTEPGKVPAGTNRWCSLIYSYWMDEGGVPWAVERLADRIENGIVRNTQPLQAVRVKEDSEVAKVISKYASIWQQGDLPHADERRKQYQAVYGFPLHCAARLGVLDTADPRHTFPPAFHRFLAEAMRFYRDARNLQMLPDLQPVRAAFDTLIDVLREGNENLGKIRPPELRAQMEFSKQVLGGYKENSLPASQPAVDLNKLMAEWNARLPGRPGPQSANHPWQNTAQAVAMMYRWGRPNIVEYTKLAESGELILVVARILGDQLEKVSEGMFHAFITLLQDAIQQYVSSYKVVSLVDLSARGAYLGAPAEAMARHMAPPSVPPLRRNWAAEVQAIA